MKTYLSAAIAALAMVAAPAAAQVVDGQNGAGGTEYAGGSMVTVETNSAAPTSNFQAPTNQATAGYTINLIDYGAANGELFGLITQTGGSSAGTFANLYFDLDRNTRSGSDLGFEIGLGGVNAFIPGVAGSVSLADALFNVASTTTVDGLTIFEFSLNNSLFNSAIAGLNYNPAVTFTGDNRLNLSQSLSYSVAGGSAFYGIDRLGTFMSGATPVTDAVPEPATWAMMLMGFGAMGVALRRRPRGYTLAQVA